MEFAPYKIRTKTLTVDVAVALEIRISDFREFRTTYLMDQMSYSVNDVRMALNTWMRTAIQRRMQDYEADGQLIPAELMSTISYDIITQSQQLLHGITVSQVLDITTENEAFDRFRAIEEKFYCTEKEIDYLTRTNEFKNRLQSEENAQRLREAQTELDLRKELDKINNDQLVHEDEMEAFVQLLQSQKRIREAQTENEELAALLKLKGNRLISEDELDALESSIRDKKFDRDQVSAEFQMRAANRTNMARVQLDLQLNKSELLAKAELDDIRFEELRKDQARQFQMDNAQQEHDLASARRQDDYADTRREKDADFSDTRREKDFDFEQRQKDAEYERTHRVAHDNLDLEKQRSQNEMDILRQKAELARQNMQAMQQHEQELAEKKHQEEMANIAAKQNMSAEQLMAAGMAGMSPEAQKAFAESFAGKNASEIQKELYERMLKMQQQHAGETSSQSTAQMEQMQQMMQQMMEFAKSGMQTNAQMAADMAAGQAAGQQAQLDAMQNIAAGRQAEVNAMKDEYRQQMMHEQARVDHTQDIALNYTTKVTQSSESASATDNQEKKYYLPDFGQSYTRKEIESYIMQGVVQPNTEIDTNGINGKVYEQEEFFSFCVQKYGITCPRCGKKYLSELGVCTECGYEEQVLIMAEKGNWIPCQCCGQQFVAESWTWYVCDKCGYHICMNCFSKHSGPYGHGGYKCSQCMTGQLHLVDGIRTAAANNECNSKLDQYLQRLRGEQQSSISEDTDKGNVSEMTMPDHDVSERLNYSSQGIIFTNTALIAKKYRNTSAQDVRDIIINFMLTAEEYDGLHWNLIDLGDDEMSGSIKKNAKWQDYAQFLSDFADGMGISKSADTPLFIIGGGDVIPMPEFPARIGHDVKTVEDSDWLYCFPTKYSWKKVSIDDALFNVARLPLDYAEQDFIDSSAADDIGGYLDRALQVMAEDGIALESAMMTCNAGKNGNNDWTWTSADVMAKLPQKQLDNDGIVTKDNMFLCPALDVEGEEYLSNDNVEYYKRLLDDTDMLFINLHGSPNKAMSGYLGSESYQAYWGMTLELVKQLNVPIINAFPCYGARYGRYFFDNNNGDMPDYVVYDREDSMLLTAIYRGKALLFTGSCTSSMCSNVIGSGTIEDHLSQSDSAIDLLMPAGYAEAMLKLYACYLFQGESAGKAMLRAKIDYLNYRARYENKDLVFLTLNQFNLFGCPTLTCYAPNATHQLKSAIKSISISSKELPQVTSRAVFDRFEQGIDGVLNRARQLVDSNLKQMDEYIRKQLYGSLELSENNLTRIESLECNGQMSYNLTYSKDNKIYPEFYVVQTDKNGQIKEILQSR